MVSTTSTPLAVANALAFRENVTGDDPTLRAATDYYLATIGKVRTAAELVSNDRLFSYAMKAYGLGSMTYAKGLMTKLLTEGTASPTALANTLTDSRYKAFAQAFDFAGRGAAATAAPSATTTVVAKYLEQSLDDSQGSQNQGLELALYFCRAAPSVTSVYGILADPALLRVVQTAHDLSPHSGEEDIDVQADALRQAVNVRDLQNPTEVQKLVARFLARWDADGAAARVTPGLRGN